ncbi:MAG: hypothetical protein MJY64_01130 [archaeon]|nr:hypothetical protein [archaeon]
MGKPKSNKDLALIYEGQSNSFARVNYRAPTGREDSWEAKAHTGDPSCYGCCGTKCCMSLVAVTAIAAVCCSYTMSPDGCAGSYWPF